MEHAKIRATLGMMDDNILSTSNICKKMCIHVRALPEDSRSLTAPGVFEESAFCEPLKVYEKTDDANV